MARNLKMELLTFSLILYQSKNCGHRIQRNDLYENFEKRGGGSREKGGGGNEIHAPCACAFYKKSSFQYNTSVLPEDHVVNEYRYIISHY